MYDPAIETFLRFGVLGFWVGLSARARVARLARAAVVRVRRVSWYGTGISGGFPGERRAFFLGRQEWERCREIYSTRSVYSGKR